MSCPDFGDATCFCDMCENFVVPEAYMSDRCKKCHDRIWAELEGENGRPVFATPVTEWIDKMVHRDVNGIPWMWIEFAGIDDDDQIISQWIGIFDSE